MTQEEIIEGNKLIAEFMFPNLQKEIDEGNIILEEGVFAKACMIAKDYDALRYHSSWDWLMPIVMKINSTPLWEVYSINDLATALTSVDIGYAYKLIVDFIKEYNKNRKNEKD